MPIVPKLEPVANEITYASIEVSAGRPQAGRPPAMRNLADGWIGRWIGDWMLGCVNGYRLDVRRSMGYALGQRGMTAR